MLKLEFVLLQMHTALVAFSRYEANDVVANSRINPSEAWRRLEKLFDPLQEKESGTFFARSFVLEDALCWNLKLESNDWNPTWHVVRKQRGTLSDDMINLAGLKALVLDELEKHLRLNSNRFRTFDHARLEIVTFVDLFENPQNPSRANRGLEDTLIQ